MRIKKQLGFLKKLKDNYVHVTRNLFTVTNNLKLVNEHVLALKLEAANIRTE